MNDDTQKTRLRWFVIGGTKSFPKIRPHIMQFCFQMMKRAMLLCKKTIICE